MPAELSPLFTWRSAIADSDLPPSSRLVAFVLSLHMNERGGSCFPAIDTLAKETGLGRSTVIEQLNKLHDKGWISKQKGGGRRADGRGIPTVYTARTPHGDEGSSSRTVDPDPVDNRTYSPDDTPEGSSSRTQGRHEDVSNISSSNEFTTAPDAAVDAVIAAAVEFKASQALDNGTQINNLDAYKAKIEAKVDTSVNRELIEGWMERFPTAPISVLVSALFGEKRNLALYERGCSKGEAEPAPVVQLRPPAHQEVNA